MTDAPLVMSVDGAGLTWRDVADRAVAPLRVEVTTDAWARIAASHDAGVLAVSRRPVYGRSTGLGGNKGVDVSRQPEHALGLLRSHATSAGELRSPDRVRAMLLVRLNQLAAGGSGISPSAVAALVEMINADALPPVREHSGIGTGDLPALATIALGLLGERELTHRLAPAVLGRHDALPFVSSNAATLADAALAGHRLQTLARAGLAVAALTAVAVNANLEAFLPAVALAVPGAGGAEVSRTVRGLLRPAPPQATRIQDPFALRCLPQVNGPVLDSLQHLEDVVTAHLNVTAENPMIVAVPGDEPMLDVAHHGAFHLSGLALACDTAAIAVAQSVPLLLGRLAMLVDPIATGLPAFLGDGRPGASGVMMLEYLAASALAVLRSAAAPASLGSVSLSRSAEEDASFASHAAVQLLAAADAYAIALSCELVAAVRAVRLRTLATPDDGWGAVLAVCAELPDDVRDRDLTDDLALAQTLLPALATVAALAGRPDAGRIDDPGARRPV